MAEYLVFPKVVTQPVDIVKKSGEAPRPSLTGAFDREAEVTQTREAMIALKPAIEEILSRHGGSIISDGSAYGIPSDDASAQYSSFMVVDTTKEGIKEIGQLPGVKGTHFNGTMHALNPSQEP